jgi:hypothetical protein
MKSATLLVVLCITTSQALLAPRAGAGDLGVYVRGAVSSVVYRGVDNDIHEIWQGVGLSQFGDLSALTGAPAAAGTPAGYVRSDNVDAVLYRGFDNHIYELALVTDPISHTVAWQSGDLSALTGAPAAAGDPAGYVRSDNVDAVLYRGFDNHIYELSLDPLIGSWQPGDLSALTGAPAAAGDPAGYVRYDNVNSVLYRGSDRDIYEISLLPMIRGGRGVWSAADLSALTGSPPAADDPVGHRLSGCDPAEGVFYRGLDDDVHLIFRGHDCPPPLEEPPHRWFGLDLSYLAGAPPAL